MSTFAKVNFKNGNIVEQVIVSDQNFIDTLPVEEGILWIETHQENYATIGSTYNSSKNAFILFKVWDETTESWVDGE
jgi:hypothetical protein